MQNRFYFTPNFWKYIFSLYGQNELFIVVYFTPFYFDKLNVFSDQPEHNDSLKYESVYLHLLLHYIIILRNIFYESWGSNSYLIIIRIIQKSCSKPFVVYLDLVLLYIGKNKKYPKNILRMNIFNFHSRIQLDAGLK